MIVECTNLALWERSVPTPANIGLPIKAGEKIIFEYPKAFDYFFEDLGSGPYQFEIELTTVPSEVVPSHPELDFTALDEAVSRANELKVNTSTSLDGTDIYTTDMWVTEEVKTRFIKAITETLYVKRDADNQDDVDAAVDALEAAIAEFESARQAGTRLDFRGLEDVLTSARDTRRETKSSTDGFDVDAGAYWVDAEVMEALNKAIETAENFMETAEDQESVTGAIEALEAAIETFNEARKEGKKVVPEIETVGTLRPEDYELTLGNHKFSDFVAPGFRLVETDKSLHALGTVLRVSNCEDIFPDESKITEYYIPVYIKTNVDAVVVSTLISGGTKKITIDDPYGLALLLAIKTDEPTRTFTIYGNEENANAEANGVTYTLDASSCTFRLVSPDEEFDATELNSEIDGHPLSDFVENYQLTVDDTIYNITGEINPVTEITGEDFTDELKLTSFFVPVHLIGATGNVLKYTTIAENQVTKVFGTDNVPSPSSRAVAEKAEMLLIIPVLPSDAKQNLMVYPDEAAASDGRGGQPIVIDARKCTFHVAEAAEWDTADNSSVIEDEITYGDLIGEDYSINQEENNILISGTIHYVILKDMFPEDVVNATGTYVPLHLNVPLSQVVSIEGTLYDTVTEMSTMEEAAEKGMVSYVELVPVLPTTQTFVIKVYNSLQDKEDQKTPFNTFTVNIIGATIEETKLSQVSFNVPSLSNSYSGKTYNSLVEGFGFTQTNTLVKAQGTVKNVIDYFAAEYNHFIPMRMECTNGDLFFNAVTEGQAATVSTTGKSIAEIVYAMDPVDFTRLKIRVYKTEADKTEDTKYHEYTVDLEGCDFVVSGEGIEFLAEKPDDMAAEFSGKQLQELVDEDYAINYNAEHHRIEVSGTLKKIAGWSAYGDTEHPVHYAFPVKLTSTDGNVVKSRYLDTNTLSEHTFGQTNDGAGTILLIKAVEPDTHPTLTVYTAENAQDNRDGLVVSIDLSDAKFAGAVDSTELAEALKTANELLNETAESEDGQEVSEKVWWATAESRSALSDVVSQYETLGDTATEQSEITKAVEALNSAIETFKAARKVVPCFKIEIPEGTATIGGKQASELQTLQLDDHAITGNVNYVTGFTYNNKEVDDQFLVLKISSTNEKAEVTSVLQVNKYNVFPYVKDGYSIFRLDQEDMSDAKLFLKQKNENSDGTLSDLTDEYDLSGITVEAGPELPAYILAAKGADRSQSWLGMDYSTLVGENYWARLLGTDIIAHGDLYKVTTWEQNHSADGKYCAPIDVTATIGNVIGKADKDYKYVFEKETDTIIWQFGDNTETQFILYNNEEDYNSKTNGNTYTVSIAKCRLISPGVDTSELDEVIAAVDAELKETAISSDGSNIGDKIWYASKEAVEALKKAEKQYTEAFKAEDQAAIEAAVVALTEALRVFNEARKSVACYEFEIPDGAVEIGNKTVQELQTDVTASDTEITGTLNWVKDFEIGNSTVSGNFLIYKLSSDNEKATVASVIQKDSVILPTIMNETEYTVLKAPSSLDGYTITINQTTEGNDTGEPDQTKVYDLSKLTITPNPNPAPTLTISAPEDTEEFYGVQAQKFQSKVTSKPTNRVAGNLHHMEGMGGFSGDEANGYFLALKFETNGDKLTTEITNGAHPGEVDALEDKYCVYRITDPENQEIKVKAELNGEVTERTLNLSKLILDPYIKSVDIAGQEESWKGVTYKDLMSPNFTATLEGNTIKLHGDLYQCFDWEAFGSDLQDKWYVVMGVTPSVDGVVRINKLNGTYGTANVTADETEDLVLAFDEEHKNTQTISVHLNKDDADNNINGTAYTLDASTSLFQKFADKTELKKVIDEAHKLLNETTKFDTGGAMLESGKIWYVGSDWWEALDKLVTEHEGKLTSITDSSQQGEIDAAVAAIKAAINMFNSDKRVNVLFHVDVVPETTEIGGKHVYDLQSDVKVSKDNKITGVVHRVEDFDGNKSGYFLALTFNAHSDKVTVTPELKTVDDSDHMMGSIVQVGDYSLINGTPFEKYKLIVTQHVKDADEKYDVKREYDLSGIEWKLDVFVNSVQATKWGYAKTKAELDTLIEQGESAKIDHDNDIFFAVYTKPEHNVVMNVTVDGTQYACICDGANGSLVGAGASTSGHATDFDFKSTDGKTWTKCDSAVDVSGKTVSMALYTYAEDVTNENAPTVLATTGTMVLGSQIMNCSESQLFEGFANTIGVEKWGYLKDKADAEKVEAGQSASLTHDHNIFFYKLKSNLEADGKKYATLIEVDGKTYAAIHAEDAYQYHYVSLDEPNDAAFVSSDNGATWTATSGPEDVTGKTIELSVVKAEEDITPENAATVLKTVERVFGSQELTCNITVILNSVKTVSMDDLKKLNPDQLKDIVKELGLKTTAKKAATLLTKIKDSNVTDDDLTNAYNKVVR